MRILAATRRGLDREVQAGRFRDDLFFRLAVARIELPPLRERGGDVDLLARAFWASLGPSAGPFPPEFLARYPGCLPANHGVEELADRSARWASARKRHRIANEPLDEITTGCSRCGGGHRRRRGERLRRVLGDLVYDASADTKADVGIAKWGFTSDPEHNTTVFRGYGDKNELLVEVRQILERPDMYNERFTMTMTGAKATAAERIEYAASASADGKDTVISMNVVENTFDEGSVAARVLLHIGADAKASVSGAITNGGSGSLTGKSRPLDANSLVTNCNDTVNRCQVELIDSRIAAAGAATDCSLTRRVGYPLISTIGGALVGGLITLETGPGAIVGAAAGGVAGSLGFGIAGHQCASSQADAAKAAADLRKCQQANTAQCAH